MCQEPQRLRQQASSARSEGSVACSSSGALGRSHAPTPSSDLVGAPMQLLHLLEQSLEELVIDSHGSHLPCRDGYPAPPGAKRVKRQGRHEYAPRCATTPRLSDYPRDRGRAVRRSVLATRLHSAGPGAAGRTLGACGAGPSPSPPVPSLALEANLRTRAFALAKGPDLAGLSRWRRVACRADTGEGRPEAPTRRAPVLHRAHLRRARSSGRPRRCLQSPFPDRDCRSVSPVRQGPVDRSTSGSRSEHHPASLITAISSRRARVAMTA